MDLYTPDGDDLLMGPFVLLHTGTFFPPLLLGVKQLVLSQQPLLNFVQRR
ncbi:MAG: hypothetical protein CM15mP107_4880 [Bacteroidota bacterium]|nr:MAG: hypothetical protein CM15mP107_4880 [Bacteroidota bacterium]